MNIKDIAIIFTSTILEALPFLVLGALISSLIQVFVSDEMLRKIIPKNPILGCLVGVLLGFFIPACDCAVIPIALRLLKKKVPLNVCVSYMLASPIVNPVTLLSTIYVLKNTEPKLILYRIVVGIIVAILAGLIMRVIVKDDELKDIDTQLCDCCKISRKNNSKIVRVFEHAKEDFVDVMKYMMLGTLITAIVQVLMAKFNIQTFSSTGVFQNLFMMIFAYVISLCSTADVFVAKTFLYEVSNSAVLAFLILGPMIDIKNTIMLSQRCNKKFALKMVLVIFALVLTITSIIKV